MKIIIIAAIAENRVIGRTDSEMPWHIKEEFQHFKNTTLGSPIIMGRKTFKALGKPLKGRENIIITGNKNFNSDFEEVKYFHSLEESILYCKSKNYNKIFIIGGGEIFKQALSLADEMILSFMKFDAEGDVLFPEFNSVSWLEVSRENREQFQIVRYVRRNDKTN